VRTAPVCRAPISLLLLLLLLPLLLLLLLEFEALNCAVVCSREKRLAVGSTGASHKVVCLAERKRAQQNPQPPNVT
jgi:hypothetical protein